MTRNPEFNPRHAHLLLVQTADAFFWAVIYVDRDTDMDTADGADSAGDAAGVEGHLANAPAAPPLARWNTAATWQRPWTPRELLTDVLRVAVEVRQQDREAVSGAARLTRAMCWHRGIVCRMFWSGTWRCVVGVWRSHVCTLSIVSARLLRCHCVRGIVVGWSDWPTTAGCLARWVVPRAISLRVH